MIEEKAIRKMNKSELQQLFEETSENVNLIKSFSKEIEGIKQSIIEANKIINDEGGFVSQIERKSEEVEDAYNELLVDDENGESVKTQLENILTEFEDNKKKFDELQKNVFGYEKISEMGETQKIKGLFEEINDFHQKQEEMY